jgi:Mor family transcriptional regulator
VSTTPAAAPEVDISMLPPILQRIEQRVGLAATMAIVEQYGGVRLYVPLNPAPDHPLAKLIGLDKAQALAPEFGAEEHFPIPKAERALRALRDARIRADRQTKTIRQLAREYGLIERRIHQILGEDGTEQQQDLFAS